MTAEVHPLPNKADAAVNAAIMTAIKGLANFSPTRIVGEPDAADAENLKFNLLELAEIIDPLVQAIGEYAHHHFGIQPADQPLFKDLLRDGLDGNATYVLQKIADDYRAEQDQGRFVRAMVNRGMAPSHVSR